MSGDFQLPPIRRVGKERPGSDGEAGNPPVTDARTDQPADRRPDRPAERRPDRRPAEENRRPAGDDRRPAEADRRPSEKNRRPSEKNRRQAEENRRPAEPNRRPTERNGRPADENRRAKPDARPAAAKNPRKTGPHIVLSGRVMRAPESTEKRRPSIGQIKFALVVLALAVLLPAVLANLGFVVILLIVGFWISRKVGLGRGGGHRRDRNPGDQPMVRITTFRVGLPKPEDPRAFGREISCRLSTDGAHGPVELASGDMVTVRGWQNSRGLVDVGRLEVTSTGSRTRAAMGASTNSVTAVALLILIAAGVSLFAHRSQLTGDALSQSMAQVNSSVSGLIVTVLTLAVIWFLFKRLIFRR